MAYTTRAAYRVNGTLNDSRALQFAELLGERSLCDSGNSTLQFGEPLGALEELIENGGFPASTDDTCGGFYRTEFWTLRHNGPSSYCIPCIAMYRISSCNHADPSSSILATMLSDWICKRHIRL